MPVPATPPSPPAIRQRIVINPSDADVSAEIEAAARRQRVPAILLKAIVWKESRWQFAPDNKRANWRDVIEQDAKRLAMAFFRAPIIGNGSLDDGRDILESWFYALGRYATGKNGGTESAAFANAVLDTVAAGGQGRWSPVTVSRPRPEQTADGRHIFGPPVPWHFAGIAPRPPAHAVVDLPAPYLSQVWDTPDDFRGGGSCGPTSMVMALIYLKKLGPKPVSIADSYVHVSEYGGHVPAIDICVTVKPSRFVTAG